jgi:hypothetical protein
VYRNICFPGGYPKTNPCAGQTGICTATGWVVSDNTYCDSDLSSCCTDPLNPYPTCLDGVVSCGQCPIENKPDCKTSCTNLVGPKCTSTGWICATGYGCPSDDMLNDPSCCSAKDDIGQCILNADGSSDFFCSSCKGKPPVCADDCEMCGPVCDSDGNWQCRKGAKCPDLSKINCCPSDKPYVNCATPTKSGGLCSDTKDSTIYINCSNCDNLTKPSGTLCDSGLGTCQGHGWVCTATGWVCAPNVMKPSDDILKNCCVKYSNQDNGNINFISEWDDTTKCVKCYCPNIGDKTFNNTCASDDPTSCDTLCCPTQSPANKAPNGDCLCCQPNKICQNINKGVECCVGDKICSDQKCLSPCGLDEKGNSIGCDGNCLTIENLSIDDPIIGQLKKQYANVVLNKKDNGQYTAYVCVQPNTNCNISTTPYYLPESINNFYPCYDYPIDPQTNTIGYCGFGENLKKSFVKCSGFTTQEQCEQSRITSPDDNCVWVDQLNNTKLNTTNPDFEGCTSLPTALCGTRTKATCGSDLCEWRDIMDDLGSSTDIQNMKYIDNEMKYLFGNKHGSYCYTQGDKNQSRIIIDNMNGCSFTDCISNYNQKGIYDIRYNEKTSNCIVLQNCSQDTENDISVVVKDKDGQIINSSSVMLPGTFNDCSSSNQCPVRSTNYFCDNGEIKSCDCPDGYDCIQQSLSCINKNGIGYYMTNNYFCIYDLNTTAFVNGYIQNSTGVGITYGRSYSTRWKALLIDNYNFYIARDDGGLLCVNTADDKKLLGVMSNPTGNMVVLKCNICQITDQKEKIINLNTEKSESSINVYTPLSGIGRSVSINVFTPDFYNIKVTSSDNSVSGYLVSDQTSNYFYRIIPNISGTGNFRFFKTV